MYLKTSPEQPNNAEEKVKVSLFLMMQYNLFKYE